MTVLGRGMAHDPAKSETVTIQFPMAAPAGATEAMFPLKEGERDAATLWLAHGGRRRQSRWTPISSAIPGAVAGLAHR